MAIIQTFRTSSPDKGVLVPFENVDITWEAKVGDDSLAYRFEYGGQSYVLKFYISGQVENAEQVAEQVGAPTIFGSLTTDERDKYKISLSQQVLVLDHLLFKVTYSPQIREDEKVTILTKLLCEKVKTFLYLIQQGYLADFDSPNVGIGEIKFNSTTSEPAVFLLDFGGAINLKCQVGAPKYFLKAIRSMTPEELESCRNQFSPDIPFMTHPPITIYNYIRGKDLANIETLKGLSKESINKIAEAVKKTYEIYEIMIASGRQIRPPISKLVNKHLGVNLEDIASTITATYSQFSISNITFG